MPPLEPPPLCQRIREAREAAGLTQDEMAYRIGVTPKTYGSYERFREPKPARLRQIAEAMGLPDNYFEAPREVPAAVAQDFAARFDRIERLLRELVAREVPDGGEPDSRRKRSS